MTSNRRVPSRIPLHKAILCVAVVALVSNSGDAAGEEPRFVDYSLLVAPEYPCTWPSHPFPRFAISHQRKIGPESAYNIDSLLIDGNTERNSTCPRTRSRGPN